MIKFGYRQFAALMLSLLMLCAAAHNGAYAAAEEASQRMELGYGITLKLEGESAENFGHAQKVGPAPVTEMFTMQVNGKEIPLFRIDFANESVGELLGVLWTEEGDVPVTYSFCPFDDAELAALDDETAQQYYASMENFNAVLDAICADPRFIAGEFEGLGESQALELTYWTLMLPETVTCGEEFVDGMYELRFYGRVQGEEVALYTVTMGGEGEELLGTYTVAGEEKPLHVVIHEMEKNVFWSEADYDLAFRMQDTVNDVLNTIMANEGFSN